MIQYGELNTPALNLLLQCAFEDIASGYRSNKCICAQRSDDTCSRYELSSYAARDNDCGAILNKYNQMLKASISFVVFAFVLSFILAVLSCVSSTSNVDEIPEEYNDIQQTPAATLQSLSYVPSPQKPSNLNDNTPTTNNNTTDGHF